MGLFELLSSFTPTAAYSFEFFKKNQDGSVNFGARVGDEIFFLIPPEESSIKEGYRISINKTIGGGWVNDFGNDFKKIRLQGSLYSYFLGYLKESVNEDQGLNGIATGASRAGTSAVNAVLQSVSGGLLDISPRVSGFDEFMKLRFVLSRWRDTKESKLVDQVSSRTANSTFFDKFGEKRGNIKKLSGLSYKDLAVVYHDYDDNNHYEVVIESAEFTRSKSDPFTMNYSIEMTGLREVISEMRGIGAFKSKESAQALVSQFKAAIQGVTQVFNDIKGVLALPFELANQFVSMLQSLNLFVGELESNFRGDWKSWKFLEKAQSSLNDLINNWNAFKDSGIILTLRGGGATGSAADIKKSFIEEDNTVGSIPVNAATNSIDMFTLIKNGDELIANLVSMLGMDKYYSPLQETINLTTNKTISDTDFDTTQKAGDGFTQKDIQYYTVQQGDTLQKIALKFYNNLEKDTIIAAANNLRHYDFENNAMIGKQVKIPLETLSSEKINNNFVYYKRTPRATIQEKETQFLGNDISLNENRDFVVDSTGDLAMVYGRDAYIENVIDRIRYAIGTLDPIHPFWGVILDIGSAPSSVTLKKIASAIESQVLSDPRTEYCFVDMASLQMNGDELRLKIYYRPYFGNEISSDIGQEILQLLP